MYNVSCGQRISSNNSFFYDLKSKIFKHQNFKTCNVNNLCERCRQRKRQQCKNYHLSRSPSVLICGLRHYFKNVPDHIIWDVQRCGSPIVEYEMRTYFEQLYITNTDDNHEYFKNSLLNNAKFITAYKNDFALSGNNFWLIILYMVIRQRCDAIITNDKSNRHLEYLNLTTATKNNNLSHLPSRGNNNIISSNNIRASQNTLLTFFENYIKINIHDKFIENKKNLDKYDLGIPLYAESLYKYYVINSFSIIFKLYKIPLKYLFINNANFALKFHCYSRLSYNLQVTFFKDGAYDFNNELNIPRVGTQQNRDLIKRVNYLDLAVDIRAACNEHEFNEWFMFV